MPYRILHTLLLALLLGASANAQATLKLIGQLDPFTGDNRYADVWGEGNYAYLGSFNGTGLIIIDITDPANPKLAGHYNPAEGGRFQDVVVTNGIAYLSSENRGGVHIVDVRSPANPVLLSQVTEAKNGYPNVHELFVAGGVLYEADSRTNRIKVFDVTRPDNPTFVRDIVTTDTRFIHAITVVNGRLFTSGWSGKTDIYDVSRILTEEPRLLGAVDSGNNSHSAWMSNDGKLMVGARETSNGDIRLFDISNPASPVQLAAITAQSLGMDAFSAHNPYFVGNLLFVSWYQAGLVVIDVTDPRQPRLTGIYDTFPGASTAGFDGCWGVYPFLGLDRVLLSDLDNGLYVIDATAALAGPRSVSAASYGYSAIAGRSIVAAFGTNLATTTLAATSLPLPTALGGSSVAIQDVLGVERLAPLYFVSPGQINYQIPAGTASGPVTVKVASGGQSSIGAAIVAAGAPSIFTLDASGAGAAAALDAFTFAAGPFNATRANGQPNVIAVFGTGLGEDATDAEANVNGSVLASIDGQLVTVTYAGRVPGLVGLNQFNIVFPAGITSGNHRLAVSRNGATSNTVSIAIR
jgi:uncharacterized protein (TIGR03437 family)